MRFHKLAGLATTCCLLVSMILLTGCPMAQGKKNPEGTWTVDLTDSSKSGKDCQATFVFNGDGTVTCTFPVGFNFSGTYTMTYEMDGDDVHVFAGSVVLPGATITWDVWLTFEGDDTMTGNAQLAVELVTGGTFTSSFTMNLTRQEEPAA